MNPETLLHDAVLASPMAVAGLAVGWIYFQALRRTVDTLAGAGAGNVGWRRALGFTLARIGGVVVFFALAAKLGALPLLAAFLGFLVARHLSLRASKKGAA